MTHIMVDRRTNNINIFNNTADLCKNNEKLVDAIAASNQSQYVMYEKDAVNEAEGARYDEACQVIVSRKRSLEAASSYAYQGLKVCVHNFASATNPGGGVEHGSSAQEEAICRCSTLYFCLDKVKKEFHYFHRQLLNDGAMDAGYNDDCVFAP